MVILWQILVQFIFRLSLGVAIALGITPSRLVTSGYYRVQLWVLMGLNTLASLAVFSNRDAFGGTSSADSWLLFLGIASAALCYIGSVIWLYERHRAGKIILLVIAGFGFAGSLVAAYGRAPADGGQAILSILDVLTSSFLLGTTLAAMLLGHWHLNTPTMELAPLKRLVVAMMIAVAARAVLCGVGLGWQVVTDTPADTTLWIFIAFRWLSGLVGAAVMAVMAWYTLKVPNTQSATGILYAGVILTFIGELMSQLLSASLPYPV